MLDLEAAVHLDERRCAVRPEQELERPCVDIAELTTGAFDRSLHRLARLRGQRLRRRLLDQLLVAPLDRTLALTEREDTALTVAEHLDLDVAGRNECLLEIERAVAERGHGFGARGPIGRLELVGDCDKPHTLAAAARCCLEQHGKADLGSGHANLGETHDSFRAGNERYSGGAHLGLRASLVASLLNHVDRRPDEDEIAFRAGTNERGILGQEAEARMHGLARCDLRGRDHIRDSQIALCCRGRADTHRRICHSYVERIAVGGGVHGNRLDVEFVERPDHAHRDLTPVRDEDAREHR